MSQTSHNFDVAMHALPPLRAFIEAEAAKARLDEHQTALLTVAVVEIATNIIRHATGLLPSPSFQVISRTHIEGQRGSINLVIRYVGDPFTPKAPEDYVDYSDLPEGGFGNFIIHNACDKVAFKHIDGYNHVEIDLKSFESV